MGVELTDIMLRLAGVGGAHRIFSRSSRLTVTPSIRNSTTDSSKTTKNETVTEEEQQPPHDPWKEYREAEERERLIIADKITNRYMFQGIFLLILLCAFPMWNFYVANLSDIQPLDEDVIKLKKLKARLEQQNAEKLAAEQEAAKRALEEVSKKEEK